MERIITLCVHLISERCALLATRRYDGDRVEGQDRRIRLATQAKTETKRQEFPMVAFEIFGAVMVMISLGAMLNNDTRAAR